MSNRIFSSFRFRAARIVAASVTGLLVGTIARWDARAGAADILNGDVNADGAIDISDPTAILGWLFLGTPGPVPVACEQGAPDVENGDANGDRTIDLSDAIHLLSWLFIAGEGPVAIHCIPSSPCLEQLDELGIAWTWGPESPGVTTPVTVTLPLGGMPFRYFGGNLRETWFMDCELTLALHRMVQRLAARGVIEVVDIGIYNYRCIGEGTPPDCPNGISMHARALAVDIAALVTSDEGKLSIEADWVIDADGRTCAARAREPRDDFLHEALCDLYDAGIFKIHLSPNYNADHRNHWHLDLTPDSGRFIR